MKLGTIANLSLAPGRACSETACQTCYKEGCYAMKAYRLYPSTKNAWDENTEYALNYLDLMKMELKKYFGGKNAPKFFRFHTGGDFISKEYAQMLAEVTAEFPTIHFLAFTKQWDSIRGVEFPKNFQVILSAWPGTEIPEDLAAVYPIAYCVEDERDIPKDAIQCPGHCDNCGMCWQLEMIKMNVAFLKH